VVFHDVAYIEVKPLTNANRRECSVAVELTDFSVSYSQDSIANAEAAIKNKGNRIVVEKGQIVKVSKDKGNGSRPGMLAYATEPWEAQKTDLDMNGVFGDDMEYVVHGSKTADHSGGARSRDDSGRSSLCGIADRPDREVGSKTGVEPPEFLVAAQ
jgi:hypothetical protein